MNSTIPQPHDMRTIRYLADACPITTASRSPRDGSLNSTIQQQHDLRNIRHLTVFSAIVLYAGIVALVLASTPAVALLGKVTIAVALVAFAAAAMGYVLIQSYAAHVRRTEDFHWT